MNKNEELFVVRRGNGDFLAVDQASGGYEYWTSNLFGAEKFRYNDRGLFYAREAAKKEQGVVCHAVQLSEGFGVDQLVEQVMPGVREQALAKLTKTEREALGFTG